MPAGLADERGRRVVLVSHCLLPERLAWGGVDKPHTLRMYGSKGSVIHALRRPLLRVFLVWTRLVYRRQARLVARDVADYRCAGIDVVGLVGIGGSPSCGVTTTLDLAASTDVVAACPLAQLTRAVMNEQAVLACRRPGQGLFVEQLERALRRRRLCVPAWEHDLALELHGVPQPLLGSPPVVVLGAVATADGGPDASAAADA